jgi:predicted enzyme related to lactoylglutathione lyase
MKALLRGNEDGAIAADSSAAFGTPPAYRKGQHLRNTESSSPLREDRLMVKDIAFVAYSVRDVPRARAFYRDVLGLTPGDEFGDHWIEFNVGSTTFGIGNGETLGYEPGASTGAAFEVDDVHGMRERVKAAGAEVSEIHEFPGCITCFARDPEGNRFALHQRRTPTQGDAA